MGSIHKDIPIDAHPADVWAAVRDFGSPHQRLVPGFVLDARLDGDARIVTFANGTVARELLVDCDDARRRLVYAGVRERGREHSASVQVLADGDTRSRLIWIVDVLPNEIASYIGGQMDQSNSSSLGPNTSMPSVNVNPKQIPMSKACAASVDARSTSPAPSARATADATPPPIAPPDMVMVRIPNGNPSAIAASDSTPSRPI